MFYLYYLFEMKLHLRKKKKKKHWRVVMKENGVRAVYNVTWKSRLDFSFRPTTERGSGWPWGPRIVI